MSRRVRASLPGARATTAGGGGSTLPDSYFDRVLKYIPADVVAAWVTVNGLVAQGSDPGRETFLWVAFALGLVLTLWWTLRQTAEPARQPLWPQVWISTGAFAVWVFALGPPFSSLAFYRPLYGSLLLLLYTLIVARLVPRDVR